MHSPMGILAGHCANLAGQVALCQNPQTHETKTVKQVNAEAEAAFDRSKKPDILRVMDDADAPYCLQLFHKFVCSFGSSSLVTRGGSSSCLQHARSPQPPP